MMNINKEHKLSFNEVQLNKIYYLENSLTGKIQVELTSKFKLRTDDSLAPADELIPSSFVFIFDKYIVDEAYQCFAFLTKDGIRSIWLGSEEGFYEVID